MSQRISILEAAAVGGGSTFHDYELQQFERQYIDEGVIDPASGKLAVSQYSGGANMSVDVAAGFALIEITNTNTDGTTYVVYFENKAVQNLPITTADPTNPRIDRVIAEVLVNADPNAAASNVAVLRVVAGTPAGSPSAPALPANAITLATVSVPASDTTISNAQITDGRIECEMKSNVFRKIMRQGMLNNHAGSVAGTNTITGTMDPAPSSYVDKYTVFFVAANDCTGAVTINLNGLGAKDIKKNGSQALVSGDLKANVGYLIQYNSSDGNFKLLTAVGNTPDGQEIGSVKHWAVKRAPANWLLCYGQAISRTTYASLFNVICPTIGTFTVTIASPAVFSLTAHGFEEGDTLFFTTTGALPTGLTANTLYYVIATGLSADNFRVSATRGGSVVNTSGSQSGTHTVRECPYGLGDGSTTFNLPDARGRSLIAPDGMGGTAASRVTSANGKGAGGSSGAESVNIDHTHISPTGACGTQSGGCQVTGAGSAPAHTGGMESNTTPNIMNPYLTMPLIIKYA